MDPPTWIRDHVRLRIVGLRVSVFKIALGLADRPTPLEDIDVTKFKIVIFPLSEDRLD